MKKIILFCLLVYIEAFAQAGYTVELKKTYCQWASPENWKTNVETVIKYNGTPIPNSNNYYYEYYLTTDDWPAVHSGYGKNTDASDATANWIQYWYVVVTDSVNHTFTNLTSETVSFQMETVNAKAKQVIFQALRSNGSTLSGVNADHWMYPVGLWGDYGQSRFLTVDHDEVLRSSPDLVTATNDKFNYWNTDQSLVFNHNHFYITTSTDPNLTANYKVSNGGITIQNNIDGFTGDSVEFKDPWLVDYNEYPYGMRNQGMSAPFKKVPSPFYPTLTSNYKGVFLNQNPNFLPNLPNYSVRAPLSQDINLGGSIGTRKFYFLNWGGSNVEYQNANALETGVVFRDANAVAEANYKGNLLSNSISGYSTNSQRKIVRTNGDGKLHMVYESLGSVWYTISIDGGRMWGQEQRVNPLDTYAKCASIAESDDGLNYVYIVYQIDRSVFPYIDQGIILTQYNNRVQQWVRTIYGLSSYTYDTKPVIAAQNNVAYVVFKPTSTSTLRAAMVLGDGTVYSSFSLNYTTSSSVNPSLSGAVQNFYLAYQNGNTEIKYFKLSVSGLISDYAVISTGSGYAYNINPSISTHDGDPIVSWSGYSSGIPAVVIRRKEGTNWSTIFKKCDNGSAAYPSNNNSRGSGNDGSIVAWTNMYNQSRFIKFTNGSYTSIYNLPSGYSGQDIQISNGEEFEQIKAINFDRNTSPKALKPIPYNFNILQKTTNGDEFNYARLVVLNKNNKEIVYGLGDVKVDGNIIHFVYESDMIKIDNSERLTSAMRTENFYVSNESKLEFSDCAYIIERDTTLVLINNIKPVIELVNASNEKIIKVKDIEFIGKDTLDERTYYKLDCKSIPMGDYYFQVKLITKENYEFSLSDCIYGENDSLIQKNNNEIVLLDNSLPTEYKLESNYPNPFNPTTTINYQIPKSGFVSLKVYDILGREVAMLVNGEKEVGKYTVQFDGSKLASGVYIYELRANEFVSVKKLMLLK